MMILNDAPIVFMYSGQGSQYYNMGLTLFQQDAEFRQAMIEANSLYQELSGISIIESIYQPNRQFSDSLTQTEITHPAIFIVEYALTQVLLNHGIIPRFTLGASHGEIAAAVTSGILDLSKALSIIFKQVEALNRCPSGQMLAVLESVELFNMPWIHQNSELAAINCPKHFVISSTPNQLNEISKKLKQKQIAFQFLSVDKGYHSSLIDEAKDPFLHSIANIEYHNAAIPFISCEQSKMISTIERAHFWNTARNPFDFQQVISQLEQDGPKIYVDLGPSGTLFNFTKYNLSKMSQSICLKSMSPWKNELTDLITFLTKS
jgi:acyl transferase domain-containing protein